MTGSFTPTHPSCTEARYSVLLTKRTSRGDITMVEAEALIHQLTDHLKKDPTCERLAAVARAQTAMGHDEQAEGAYCQLIVLAPEDAQLQAAYAEVVAQGRDKQPSGK